MFISRVTISGSFPGAASPGPSAAPDWPASKDPSSRLLSQFSHCDASCYYSSFLGVGLLSCIYLFTRHKGGTFGLAACHEKL